MIVNSKFRPPLEIIETSPIKKTYDYYKNTGNLWESKYLTSPKIAKYYHDVQQTFLTGQNSPNNFSLKDPIDKTTNIEKTPRPINNPKRIKVDSNQGQNSKRQSSENNNELLRKSHYEKPWTPRNAWERLNSLPACKLRHVIPQKLIDKDYDGIQSIMAKTLEIDKMKEWYENQRQGKRLKARLATINRHNDLKDLEQKCGIQKIREKECMEGTFGYIQMHKTRQRTELLSKPRSAPKHGDFDHEDFRGLLHADYKEAISKVRSNTVRRASASVQERVKHEDIEKETIKDIEKFEIRRKKSQNSNTSVEVLNYDMVRDFFK